MSTGCLENPRVNLTLMDLNVLIFYKAVLKLALTSLIIFNNTQVSKRRALSTRNMNNLKVNYKMGNSQLLQSNVITPKIIIV